MDDGLPVLGQLLHAGVVEVDAVRVELAVRLSFLIAEIVVGANDDIVIVDKVGSETVGEGSPETVVELQRVGVVRVVLPLGVSGDGHGHDQLGVPKGPAGSDDVPGEDGGHATSQACSNIFSKLVRPLRLHFNRNQNAGLKGFVLLRISEYLVYCNTPCQKLQKDNCLARLPGTLSSLLILQYCLIQLVGPNVD